MRATELTRTQSDSPSGPRSPISQPPRRSRGGRPPTSGGSPLRGLREMAPKPPEPVRVEPPEWRLLAGAGIALAIGVTLFVQLAHSGVGSTDTVLTAASQPAPTPVPRPASSAESPVVVSARNALSAWGRFAISGDLSDVSPYFAADGPQYSRFEREAPGLSAHPLGVPAYSFDFPNPTIIPVRADRIIVRGTITFTRAGEQVRTFYWDLKMQWSDSEQRWLVWTVVPTRG
jgi:hypothetical protein